MIYINSKEEGSIMIKLITQFDNEKSKLSLATPTCGCCCCCCCCCIVSTFAAASISARNLGNYVAKKLPNEPQKIKEARKIGFWFPLGMLMMGLPLVSWIDNIIVSIIIGIMFLVIITLSLKQTLNLSGIMSRVIIFTIMLGIFEWIGLYVGIYALKFLGVFYLPVAIIISILLISWAFGKKYDNLETSENIGNENSINNQTNEVISSLETMKVNNDNLIVEETDEKQNLQIQPQKKKCTNCGTENAVDNKICIYCSNYLETDDEK